MLKFYIFIVIVFLFSSCSRKWNVYYYQSNQYLINSDSLQNEHLDYKEQRSVNYKLIIYSKDSIYEYKYSVMNINGVEECEIFVNLLSVYLVSNEEKNILERREYINNSEYNNTYKKLCFIDGVCSKNYKRSTDEDFFSDSLPNYIMSEYCYSGDSIIHVGEHVFQAGIFENDSPLGERKRVLFDKRSGIPIQSTYYFFGNNYVVSNWGETRSFKVMNNNYSSLEDPVVYKEFEFIKSIYPIKLPKAYTRSFLLIKVKEIIEIEEDLRSSFH